MIRDFHNAGFERHPPLLYEPVVESAERVLLRYGWDYDARVVEREGLVEPEEVGVATEDGESRFGEKWRCRLRCYI